jgi:hypothetical protein
MVIYINQNRKQELFHSILQRNFLINYSSWWMEFPITSEQQRYSGWQEAVRKDIERAFGVLKAQWQILARPIMLLHTLLEIAKRASTCFILHNMLVSDRVMGDCRLLYDPAELVNTIKYRAKDVRQPSDLEDVQRSDRSPSM